MRVRIERQKKIKLKKQGESMLQKKRLSEPSNLL
jgi:hypothetical protein